MFSIITPLDNNRFPQFKNTKRAYDAMPQVKEFIIPTRKPQAVKSFLKKFDLMKDVRIIPYEHERGFNPSKALNIGVRNAKYDQIIITSPEVLPQTPVFEQLSELIGQNVVCKVIDQKADGSLDMPL